MELACKVPTDTRSEMTAIGAALYDKYAASAVVYANEEANNTLFSHPFCAKAASLIKDCISKNIEVSMETVYIANKSKRDKDEFTNFLADCIAHSPTAGTIDYTLAKLLEIAIKRHAIQSSFILSEMSSEEGVSSDEILQKIAEMQTFCSKRITTSSKTAKEAVDAYNETIKEKQANKEATGFYHMFPGLGSIIPVFKKKEMHVIAARPSIGKTALMTELLVRGCVTKKSQKAFVVSLEMSAEQLVSRMLSQATGFSSHFIEEGNHSQEQIGQIALAKEQIANSGIIIADPHNCSILDIQRMAKREKDVNGIDSLWVDYMQLIKGDNKDGREREVAGISAQLKGIARELDIPVIILAQLRRFNNSEAPIPTLDHLRESGAIEQDADSVTLIHRQRYLKDEDKANGVHTLDTQLFVAKQRNGATGISEVKYEPSSTRFLCGCDLAFPEVEDARLPYKDDDF